MKPTYAGGRWEFVARFIRKHNLKVGAELGVKEGRFTEYLLKKFPELLMYAVDIWDKPVFSGYEGEENHAGWDHEAIFKEFLQRTEPVSDRLITLKMTTIAACYKIPDNSLDFIFIDAAHTYEDVLRDLFNYLPKVKKDGWIFGHDIDWEPVRNVLGQYCPGFIGGMDNCWCIPRSEVILPDTVCERLHTLNDKERARRIGHDINCLYGTRSGSGVVIGNGLSRKKLPLQEIRHSNTIGCNIIYKDYVPNFIVTMGDAPMEAIIKDGAWKKSQIIYKPERKNPIPLINEHGVDLDRLFYMRDAYPLRWSNSGFVAAQVFILMGFSKIYLIGIDNDDTNVYRGLYDYYEAVPPAERNEQRRYCFDRLIKSYPYIEFIQVNNSVLKCGAITWEEFLEEQQICLDNTRS